MNNLEKTGIYKMVDPVRHIMRFEIVTKITRKISNVWKSRNTFLLLLLFKIESQRHHIYYQQNNRQNTQSTIFRDIRQ